jgi:outer membrane receptor protein involved in Fe transport
MANRDDRPVPQAQATESRLELKPQQQQGWDYGLEGYFAHYRLSFAVCHYDNVLKDAIHTTAGLVPGRGFRITTVNAGEIENSGWEFSAAYKLENLSISGNYSIVSSILKEPLSGTPSLKDITQPGEQMQYMPKYAAGLTIGYGFSKLFGRSDRFYTSVNMTYTSGAYSTDFVKYTYDVLINRNQENINNYGLRYYNTQLPSFFRFNLNLEYNVVSDLRFFMQLSNITNNTTAEYTSTFPSIGRGWMFGLKYNFNKPAGMGQ